MKTRESSQSVQIISIFIPCALCLLTVVSPTALAVSFAGGTGELNDPYQIATAEQLIAIGSDPNLFTKHYRLAADIDLAGTTRSQPVISWFSGSFDGNDHVVRNLVARGIGYQGLFGNVHSSGQIRNLGVIDVDVIATGSSGALAAENAGAILNCYSTGAVTSTGWAAGGLVGYNNSGIVTNSYSTAEVIGNTTVGGLVGDNDGGITSAHSSGNVMGGSDVGGLVGVNRRSISSSYSTSHVAGESDVGGLVGNNNNRGNSNVTACYSTGDVMGENGIGGLVGANYSSIATCYSTGHVTGGTEAGGLVGSNRGDISSCYSAASVIGRGNYVGGLVGFGLKVGIFADFTGLTDCYFLAPTDGGGPDNKIGTLLTSSQMKQKASFSGWDFWGVSTDGTSDLWFMPLDAYPVLVWQTEITGLTAVPNVTEMTLEQAKTVLTAAGFVIRAVKYESDWSISWDRVVRTYPHSFALAGSGIDIFMNSDNTRR